MKKESIYPNYLMKIEPKFDGTKKLLIQDPVYYHTPEEITIESIKLRTMGLHVYVVYEILTKSYGVLKNINEMTLVDMAYRGDYINRMNQLKKIYA